VVRSSDVEDGAADRMPPEINTNVAHTARVYDYWLGGKDNFPAYHALAEAILEAVPSMRAMARANRAFLGRAVRYLAADPRVLHQPPHRAPVRGKLGGDHGQQPLLLDEAIYQIGPHVDEAKRGHPRGDPLLGVASSLSCQPPGPWWQRDAQRGQRLGNGPLGRAEFLSEPRDAVAGVAAGLQVAAQVRKPEPAGLPLQPPDAAVVDHKPAVDDQLAGRFRLSRGYPCFGRTGGTTSGKPL
jgi:hypothetical protein